MCLFFFLLYIFFFLPCSYLIRYATNLFVFFRLINIATDIHKMQLSVQLLAQPS